MFVTTITLKEFMIDPYLHTIEVALSSPLVQVKVISLIFSVIFILIIEAKSRAIEQMVDFEEQNARFFYEMVSQIPKGVLVLNKDLKTVVSNSYCQKWPSLFRKHQLDKRQLITNS